MTRGITVDSGAADHAVPKRMVRGEHNKTGPSAETRSRVHYVSATSNRIPNEGETDLIFTTDDGVKADWAFQIAEGNKVLASVSFLVDTGHRLIFDKHEETGEDINFITRRRPEPRYISGGHQA